LNRPGDIPSMHLKRLVIVSIIGTGISSVTTQLLTVREFLSQFHGNEITISLVLFSWLLLSGLGSLAAKFFKKATPGVYIFLCLLIAVWPLLQIVFIRHFRENLFLHGTAPGFYAIFFYTVAMVAPYCLLAGFVLPYALGLLRGYRYRFDTGGLYLTDSIGDIAGGILFSFLFVYWLKPFPTIGFASAVLAGSSLALIRGFRRHGLLVLAVLALIAFYILCSHAGFEIRTLGDQYGDIVRYTESPYGRIVVSREKNQYTLWASGTPIYSGSNIIESEEKIHYPLSQLDRLQGVLLLSGATEDTLREVYKHDPEAVDYVELDPGLTAAALDLQVIRKRPRLQIINTDGRHYIKTTDKRYDAVILDLPDPDTFQLNRFFTSNFVSMVKDVLTDGGVLSTSMAYAPDYISELRGRKLATLYKTLKQHFQDVMVMPGQSAYFICRDGELWRNIPRRLRMKSIETAYIQGFFSGNVTEDRVEELNAALDRDEPINTDFQPRLMHIVFQEWFTKHGTSPAYFLLALGALTALYLKLIRREEYILFSTGLANMGVEMLVIFAFQVIYGYIYLKIGAVVTAFLLGLLPGALVGNASGRGPRRLLASEILILCMLALFLVWAGFIKVELAPWYFLAYSFVFSFLCGFQFPMTAKIIGEEQSPAAGCLAADLTGASVGTIAAGTVMIPLWGIQFAAVFLILVKLSSSLILLTRGMEARP